MLLFFSSLLTYSVPSLFISVISAPTYTTERSATTSLTELILAALATSASLIFYAVISVLHRGHLITCSGALALIQESKHVEWKIW